MSGSMSQSRSFDRSFVVCLGVTVAAIVFYGFSHTVDHALFHPKTPPPLILYVHVLASSAWLILFVAQSALVRSRNVRLHRRLGLWGLGLGTAVSVIGFATVIVMRKRDIALHPGSADAVAFLSIPLYSFASFAVPFSLAAWWRKRPDLHRRLMILATISLTQAALARVPALGRGPWIPIITTALFVAAAAEDWVRTRRLHPVYAIGVPLMILLPLGGVYLANAAPPAWMAIARFILRWT
jgi:hypothetical protein